MAIKRRFKITGVTSTAFPGINPASPVEGVTVTAELAGNPGQPVPPGGYQWAFDDPDGAAAAFFTVNKIVEISFTAVPASGS